MKTFEKKFAAVAALFFIIYGSLSAQTLTRKTVNINSNCGGYYEYLPINYSSTSQTYPTIFYCSGAEGLGTGSQSDLQKLLNVGIPYYINQNKFPTTFTVNGVTSSFIVIAPQFKQNSSAADVKKVIDYALSNGYRIDKSRMYICGYSVGGGATFRYASSGLDASVRLAAISPVSAYFSPYVDTGAIYIAKPNLPVWAMHSNADEIAPVTWSQDFVNAINSYNPNPLAKITRYNGLLHTQTWQVAFDPQTRENGLDMYEWMLQYQRSLAPYVDAGADKTIVLPYNSITLTGNAVDPDGTVNGYQWTKVSGPDQFTIVSPGLSQTAVNGLGEGVYKFELSATDNNGLVGRDTVTITVYPQISTQAQRILINPAPSANAINGPDQWGKYWNNMTDARAGIRVANAVTTDNTTTSIGLEVITRIDGTFNVSGNGLGNTNASTTVGDYPSKAVVGYAFSYTSTSTVGRWRIFGLLPQVTYTIKFWGYKSGVTDGRFIQIKKSDETTWKEYNGANNTNFNTGAVFTITGVSEVLFDMRTKTGSSFGYINVIDIQNAATGNNKAPVANAGADQNITLPINTVTLKGSGNDSDGTISTYAWAKISGPAQFTIANPGSAKTDITNLVQGQYAFELTVTDNAGVSAKDTAFVTVNPDPNIKPTANAGFDQTITLPANTVTLTGSGNDSDGYINAYAWTKISGPAQFTINSPGSSQTDVTNLTQGQYYFQLTVTDNSGATAKDTVVVTVNPDPNIKPTANAGLDQIITLPANSVTLRGSGNDTDGYINAYAWMKISGPAQFIIVNTSSAQTDVTNLVQGQYYFELTVTDNDGATAKDTIVITVNPDPTSSQRILINVGPSSNAITVADQWGKFWNNMTDGRAGIRVTNAVTTTKLSTTLGLEVINRIDGTYSTGANGLNNLNTSGSVGDYPQNAVLGYAFAHNSTTSGRWRIFGLDVNRTYAIKFWGFRGPVTDAREIQIKQTTETVWKEYNASNNSSFTNAVTFNISGVTEVSFDIRVKTGGLYGYINVIDIQSSPIPTALALNKNISKTSEAKNDQTANEVKNISVFPNPAANWFTLKINSVAASRLNVSVLNAYGRECRQLQLNKPAGILYQPMSLQGLPRGIYFVKVIDGKNVQVAKVIKQ